MMKTVIADAYFAAAAVVVDIGHEQTEPVAAERLIVVPS